MVWANARSALAHTIPAIPGAAEPHRRPARALSLGHFLKNSILVEANADRDR